MKKRILTIVAGLTMCSFMAVAQEEVATPEETTTVEVLVVEEEESSSELSISGSVDAYYRTVLGADGGQAPGSSFANGNQFSIGMANLVLAKDGEKTGFVADLVFGPRGGDAVFNSSPSSNIVNQLYAYWNASDNVTLTLGNFNTFLGYEVISPTGNFNYSTSYMFSYGPFSHTGLKADIAFTDELSLMVGVFNPTDFTETSPQNNLTTGLQLGYANDQGGAWLNFLGGNQGGDATEATTMQIDLTTGWDVTEELYLGLNATKNWTKPKDGDEASFSGAALYAQYAISDAFALGLRGEYFSEAKGYLSDGADTPVSYTGAKYDTDGNNSIIDLTVSGNIFLGDLTIIPEIRIDMASDGDEAIYGKDFTGAYMTDGGTKTTSSLASFLVAAVYAF